MLKKYREKSRIKVVFVELYERLVLAEREKVEYLEKLLGGKLYSSMIELYQKCAKVILRIFFVY